MENSGEKDDGDGMKHKADPGRGLELKRRFPSSKELVDWARCWTEGEGFGRVHTPARGAVPSWAHKSPPTVRGLTFSGSWREPVLDPEPRRASGSVTDRFSIPLRIPQPPLVPPQGSRTARQNSRKWTGMIGLESAWHTSSSDDSDRL